MTDENETKSEFLSAVTKAIEDQTFVKLTLGKYRGEGEPQKAVATLILLKGAPHLKIVTRRGRSEETKNVAVATAADYVASVVGRPFLSATLFTTESDISLTYSKKGETRLARAKPTLTVAVPATHDRAKAYLVPPDRPYLKALKVSDAEGRVKPSMQGKYRQICRFVEIVDGLLSESDLAQTAELSIVDIGSGKGYLTFALYDHVTTTLGRSCRMRGIEVRADLVEFCNGLASELGFSGLSFAAGEAAEISADAADVVIALHACDTATDDALALGINGAAKLILVAPCCQHELAPQIKATTEGLDALIKYPLLKQRLADLVTDAARALLLEASGYKTKVIEFVATEHTAKNIMIAAVRTGAHGAQARRQYDALKHATGFAQHHLDTQLRDKQ
jgi:hypothetical protein